MGLFAGFKKAVGGAAREMKADYSQNKDFLEACCAVVALVAYADGELEEAEKQKAFDVVNHHPTLSKIYKSEDVQSTLQTMFKRADSYSGRTQLMRELDDIKGKGAAMCEDAYLIGLDIAHADGELEEAEARVLTQIGKRLNVDLSQFGVTA